MSRTTYTINYLGSAAQYLMDLTISKGQYLRYAFTPENLSYDVTDLASSSDLNRCAQLQALVTAGTLSVTTTEGADDIIGVDGVISTAEITNLAVTTAKIDDLAVTAGKIGALAVTTAKIDDLGVTTGKLAANAVTAAKVTDAIMTPAKMAVAAAGIGVPILLRVAMTSGGAAGTGDDITVYNADAPFKFRVVDTWAVISTVGASDTVALYTAASAGGTQLSGTIDCSVAGQYRSAAATPTATSTVASAGSMYINRSDRSVVGEFFALIVRES